MFMDYCRSKQLRPKTMASYEQTLKLFSRWLKEKYDIENAEEVKEPHIRAYIVDLQQRGKYTFCTNDRSQDLNHPMNRRDYRQTVLVMTCVCEASFIWRLHQVLTPPCGCKKTVI